MRLRNCAIVSVAVIFITLAVALLMYRRASRPFFDVVVGPTRGPMGDFAVSTDGAVLLTAMMGGELALWSIEDGSQTNTSHIAPIVVAVHHVARTNKWAVVHYDEHSRVRLSHWDHELGLSPIASAACILGPQYASFSHNGEAVAIDQSESQIGILRSDSTDASRSIMIPGGFLRDCFALNMNGRRLVVVESDNVLSIWDVHHAIEEPSFVDLHIRPSALAVAGKESLVVAIISENGRVVIADVISQETRVLTDLRRHSIVWKMALSSDGVYLAITNQCGDVWIYDVPSHTLRRRLYGRGRSQDVAFAPQAAFVAVSRVLNLDGFVGIAYINKRMADRNSADALSSAGRP